MSDAQAQETGTPDPDKRVFNKLDWKSDEVQAWFAETGLEIGGSVELTSQILSVLRNDVARKVNLLAKRETNKDYLDPADQHAIMNRMTFWDVFNASTGTGERTTGDPVTRAAKELLRSAVIAALQEQNKPVSGEEGREYVKAHFNAQWAKPEIAAKYLGYAKDSMSSGLTLD